MKIVILDGSAANPGDISWDEISKFGELTVYDVTKEDEIIDRVKDAEIAITNKTPFTKETIEQLPNLKYIGVLATGFNVVDLKACAQREIVVTNVPEYSTFATMQHTIALLLSMTNHVASHSSSVHNGDWIMSSQFCYWNESLIELYGKTIVIVGFGKIGRQVAAAVKAFGMNVIAVPHSMPKNKDEFEGIEFDVFENAIKKADFITLHCPLTDETKEIINASSIALMKNDVRIINAARGGLVNERDLRSALESGKIAHYAADVVSVEPMLENNPLYKAPNCTLTPHIAWAPKETRERLITIAAENIECFLKGSPINKVN